MKKINSFLKKQIKKNLEEDNNIYRHCLSSESNLEDGLYLTMPKFFHEERNGLPKDKSLKFEHMLVLDHTVQNTVS